jgi:hypothetical protein
MKKPNKSQMNKACAVNTSKKALNKSKTNRKEDKVKHDAQDVVAHIPRNTEHITSNSPAKKPTPSEHLGVGEGRKSASNGEITQTRKLKRKGIMNMPQRNPSYPLNDPAYDVIVIIHEKSKALEAYEHYLSDLQHDTALRQALVQIRHDEQRHIATLKAHLPRLLTEPIAE